MIKAILFDQDGVIIDSERNGHRLAYEQAFRQFGFDIHWDPSLYHHLLQIAGGKERLKYYFEHFYDGVKPDNLDRLVRELHKEKTTAFLDMIENIPLRPGIRRFMTEANEMRVPIGICTTSSERVAQTVKDDLLKGIHFDVFLAGDMVASKKPDPEIYQTAIRELQIEPSETLVIEDSNIGIRAAKAACCHVLATYNSYTQYEDLTQADLVVSSLGERPDTKVKVKFLSSAISLADGDILSVRDVLNLF